MLERLIILACATWYLSYSMTNTDGLFGVFAWLRENWPHILGGRTQTLKSSRIIDATTIPKKTADEYLKDGLFDCIICTAVWVGIILSLLTGGDILTGVAAAGLALLAHSFTGWRYSQSVS